MGRPHSVLHLPPFGLSSEFSCVIYGVAMKHVPKLTFRLVYFAAAAVAAVLGFAAASYAETSGVANSAAPPAIAPSADSSAGVAAPVAEVKGFRSALFGMSEAEVRTAASKDFGVSADAVKSSQNPVERTQALTFKAPDVLPDGGAAEIAYVLGFKTKKLIQVSVSWSKAADDKLTSERLTSNAETLRAYFLGAGYKPDTIVRDVPVSNGLLLFRGSDGAGHTTALMLQGAFSGEKAQRTLSPSGLSLFYLADAKNPDVYRLPPGKF